jgi:hypothetical protein
MFRNNVTFNTNEDFRSQFNSDWAGKLIIVVDEVLLNRREDSERLKNLSTTLSYKVEAKGKDRDEIAFFAKFVLCSNNERLPVIIDPGETRYWVRKIHHLENDDTHFLQKLIEEIPAFLYFLQHRTLTTQNVSRMWFSPKQTETAALLKIIRCNKSKYEVEAAELIKEIMECMEIDSFSFCLNDLLILLNLSQVRIDKHWLRKIVTEDWKLAPAPNGLTYTTYMFGYDGRQQWTGNDCYQSFIRLLKGHKPSELHPYINKMKQDHFPLKEWKKAGISLDYDFTVLSEMYTQSPYIKKMGWIMGIIAFVLLFTSVMNYLLIIVGNLVTRSREMAVRKCYGAEPKNIHAIVFSEALVHVGLSIVLAAILVFLSKGTVENFLSAPVSVLVLNRGCWILVAICLLVLLVGSRIYRSG